MAPNHLTSSLGKWKGLITLVAILADVRSAYELLNTPSAWTFWVVAAVGLAMTGVSAYLWLARRPGQIVMASGASHVVPRFPALRRYVVPVVAAVALVGGGLGFWQWDRGKLKPGVFRVLVTDLDQDCKIEPKAPLKYRIRKELQDQALKVGAYVEVVMVPESLRADETRQKALTVLKRERGHVLIWGNYSCTRTDVEMDIRAEWTLDGVDLDIGRGIRQAKLTELDSLVLPNLAAKSMSGVVFLLLALSEHQRQSFGAMEKLSIQAARSLEDALGAKSAVPRESEQLLAAAAYFAAGVARYYLANWDGSAQAFGDAVRIKPDKHEAFYNWEALAKFWSSDIHSDSRGASFGC